MRKWLYSTNHKNIETLYFIFGIWSELVSTSLSLMIRTKLGNPGSLIEDDQIYNTIVNTHTFIMIFL